MIIDNTMRKYKMVSIGMVGIIVFVFICCSVIMLPSVLLAEDYNNDRTRYLLLDSRIIEETEKLLTDPTEYRKMAKKRFIYGNGKASKRIVKRILEFYKDHNKTKLHLTNFYKFHRFVPLFFL